MSDADQAKKRTKVNLDQLELREVTGDELDAVKAALVDSERVHPFSEPTIDDLSKHRLARSHGKPAQGEWDKHCFGLFAPKSHFPQAAVYVNLRHLKADEQGKVTSDQLPGNIAEILSEEVKPVANPNTAIFYTISNMTRSDQNTFEVTYEGCNDSLAERLIKKVAEHLGKKENGAIQNFSTLSPLRSGVGGSAKGFAQWLDAKLESGGVDALLTPIEKETLGASPAYGIRSMRDGYQQLGETQKSFFNTLMKDLGVFYLAEEKSPNVETIVRDPVGQFHLSNGAQIANIHYQHNATTESDQKGGGGLMVNYRYELDKIAQRKHAYKESGAVALNPEMAERHQSRMSNNKAPAASISDVSPVDIIKRGNSL